MDELEKRYRERSLWLDGIAGEIMPRPSLQGNTDCDVAIVGAGLSGLWTAYYLKSLAPDLRVMIIEREIAGFGASGRSGGIVNGGIAGDPKVYARDHDAELIRAAERMTYAAVDDIAEVIAMEKIDCGWQHSGWIKVANTPAQRERLHELIERKLSWGGAPEDWRFLDKGELEERVRIPGGLAGVFSPHAARVDPARLVRGLADAVERLGVTIHERTEALSLEPGRVVTTRGVLSARQVVRATEAFTVQLPGQHRRFLPIYSLMIATEPLDPETWTRIGLDHCEAITGSAHLGFYGQRTADNRLAVGGRAAQYRLGSPVAERYERSAEVVRRLKETIKTYFPAASTANITHHWGGALAVPRDWCQSIQYDDDVGLAVVGGYSGHGMVNSHLAGRAVADLLLGRASDVTRFPWIGHRSRRWEFEPMRFLASRSIIRLLQSADRVESGSTRTARRVALVRPLIGGYY